MTQGFLPTFPLCLLHSTDNIHFSKVLLLAEQIFFLAKKNPNQRKTPHTNQTELNQETNKQNTKTKQSKLYIKQPTKNPQQLNLTLAGICTVSKRVVIRTEPFVFHPKKIQLVVL